MTATISADGLLPLHVSEEDSLVEEGTDTEMSMDDIELIVAIREREESGEHASANWFRSALAALRSTKRANRYLEEALNESTETHGDNGSNGSNGTGHR
jgi:hypothetical protein